MNNDRFDLKVQLCVSFILHELHNDTGYFIFLLKILVVSDTTNLTLGEKKSTTNKWRLLSDRAPQGTIAGPSRVINYAGEGVAVCSVFAFHPARTDRRREDV